MQDGNTFEWYEIVAVSSEFMKIIEDMPEASTCPSIQIGDKIIEGAKPLAIAGSWEEVIESLPELVAGLVNPTDTYIRIVKNGNDCQDCSAERKTNPGKPLSPCPHNLPTIHCAWSVDVKAYLKSQANMNYYSLDDLNEISPGLGDDICSILNGVDGWWKILEAEKKIEEKLLAVGVKPEEVFINKGMAEGKRLDEAVKQAKFNIEMAERLAG